MNPLEIIKKHYTPGTRGHDILVEHGRHVARKAMDAASCVPHLTPDILFIEQAAMLHDIGIYLTDTPQLDCKGSYPYICHGYLGRKILENENLFEHALVCERHVGVGIGIADIQKQKLPLPEYEMMPISIEEQIICYADKFFSKDENRLDREKPAEEIIAMLKKFGPDKAARFESWMKMFGNI